ncbi:MAG: hypothetical protein ABR541_03430 [Candidatus Dormibacteria bacterium]
MARLLCARFPHLSLLAAWSRHPELRGEPVILGGRPELRLPVLGCAPAAEAAGVCPGMPLRQAQQLCPTAVFVPVDVEATERLRARVLESLCAVAPRVEMGDDAAYADLSGRHAAHADEEAWATGAARALGAALGEAPAVGVAGSRFVARLAATRPQHIRRVRAGGEGTFLAALPISVLPVPAGVRDRLHLLGLECLGAVAGLAPADLERQFGHDGLLAHRFARGIDDSPLTPHTAPRYLAERLVLDGAVAGREVLRFATRRLVEELGERLLVRGLSAGSLRLVLEGEAAVSGEAERVLPVPAGSGAELWELATGLLAAIEPRLAVTALRLEAGQLSAGGGRQADLLRSGDASAESVERALVRIEDRFGAGTVRRPRLAVDPGDLPERRFGWMTPAAPVGGQGLRGRWQAPQGDRSTNRAAAVDPVSPAPPARGRR